MNDTLPAPDPDGYVRYVCEVCGAVVETTLTARSLRSRCSTGWLDLEKQARGCGGAIRSFSPRPPITKPNGT